MRWAERLGVKLVVGGVAATVFVLSVPLLVFSSSILTLVFDPGFYAQGQVQQQVEQVYGLSQRALGPVNRGIVRYFGTDSESLAQSLSATGADPSFFSQRETIHMADVRALVRLVKLVQRTSLFYGIMLLVASALLLGTRAVGRIGTCLVVGGILTVVVVIFVGTLTAADFGDLFLRFHLLLFSNEFWMLDPRTDHLIQMFPFGFWYSATLFLVVRSLLTTIAVVAMGGFFVWLGRRLL